MDSLPEHDAEQLAGKAKPNPLEIELHVTSEAAEKLREALAERSAAEQWIRIYPQGIS